MSKYKIIYADPPWGYQNWTDKKNGAAISHYDPLTEKELCDLPVSEIADDNSLCFMWATFPKIVEALQVLESWGFKYITTPFVWNKTYKDEKPYCGLGFWTRSGAEIVLMGKRGKGTPRLEGATNVRQVITAPVLRPHSSKPPEVRDRIIQLVGDQPKIELFARSVPDGWDGLGDELDGKDIRDSLPELINGGAICVTAPK